MRMTTKGLLVLAAALALVTGCTTGRDEPAAQEDAVQPSGSSDLTPVADATGERSEVYEGVWLTIPSGSVTEPVTEPGTGLSSGVEDVLYRMPDANAETAFPALRVAWQPGALASPAEESLAHLAQTKINPAVTDYERVEASWPGSDEAVVTTWTEELRLVDGTTRQVDALVLWVKDPAGTMVSLIAFAPVGELEGSTSLVALRSLTLSATSG